MISPEILRILFGLIAVIGMIGVAALAARKLGLASASGGLVRRRRLALVETLALDARRRVAIIKCDGAEHLIILGATSETVIDRNLEGALDVDEEAMPANPFAEIHASIAAKFRPAEKSAAKEAA
jgi:flagellar protein FliO/FliZ